MEAGADSRADKPQLGLREYNSLVGLVVVEDDRSHLTIAMSGDIVLPVDPIRRSQYIAVLSKHYMDPEEVVETLLITKKLHVFTSDENPVYCRRESSLENKGPALTNAVRADWSSMQNVTEAKMRAYMKKAGAVWYTLK